MKGYIEHPWRNRGTAFSDQINEMLGLAPKQKLPEEGMPPRLIRGIEVWVRPLPPKVDNHRRFSLRVRGRCPFCQCEFAVSRLAQHAPACKQRDNYIGE